MGSFAVCAFLLCGCKKEEPTAPAPTVAELVRQLSNLSMDDNFFAALETIRQEAAKPEASPEAREALFRAELNALAAGIAVRAPWLARIAGAGPQEPKKIATYLAALAQRSADEALAADLRVVAGMFDKSQVGDLSSVLERAESDNASAPALRLILAARVSEALKRVVGSLEHERGVLFMEAIPGWPNPPTSDPMKTAFPTALQRLSRWLAMGEEGEKGLASYYGVVRNEVTSTLEPHVFPMPVAVDSWDKPYIGESAGFTGLYSPLVVAGLKQGELYAGLRSVIAWKEGGPKDITGALAFPGKVLLSGDALLKPSKEQVGAVANALRELVDAATPLEEQAYAQAKGARNSERKDRGLALLWVFDPTEPSSRLEAALALAEGTGFKDVRLVAPRALFRVLPVFFRSVPELPGVQPQKGPTLIVAIDQASAEVYPPPRCPIGEKGWPEGVRVLKEGKQVYGLQVLWNEETGFGPSLSQVLGQLIGGDKSCAFSQVVPVVVRSADVIASRVVSAAAEVLAVPGPAFQDIQSYFPGIVCAEGSRCPALIPSIFSNQRVRKPAKTEEAKVEVTRPLGFCDQKEIARVMAGRAGAVRACYELYLQRNPDLQGRLEIRFTIEEDGSVSGLTVTTNELNEQVATCVLRQISTLKFPKPAGGVCIIRWPYRFRPGGD